MRPSNQIIAAITLCVLSYPYATLAETALAAAVLPSSRSVAVDSPATLFVTLINGGAEEGINCRIQSDINVPAAFTYQTTDPATNEVTGSPGTPVDLDPGEAQSFVIVMTPTAETAPTEVRLGFLCDNAPRVAAISGVNTFDFSASSTPVADIIALGLTPTADGVVAVPTTSRINAFSVASVNLGASARVQVQAQLSNPQLAAVTSMCQTDPVSGACINPTAPTSDPVVTDIDSQQTPTFAVFVTTNGTLAFDPAGSRVNVRFSDESGAVRGSTSVAVRSRELIAIDATDLQGTTLWSDLPQPGFLAEFSNGQTFSADGTGTAFESGSAFFGELSQELLPHPFTWNIDGSGELNQQFQNYFTIELLSGPDGVFDLEQRFGLPREPSEFLLDLFFSNQLVGPFEVERNILSRKTTAASRSDGKIAVSSATAVAYSMDTLLTNNGWTGALPVGTTEFTTRSEQLVTAAIVAQATGQTAESGQTWALPFLFSPQDPLVPNTSEGFFVDALTLMPNGSTSTGRLSAESLSWSNQNNTLVLTSGDEEYRYTTTDLQNGKHIALVQVSRGGNVLLIGGRTIALADTTGSTLAGDLLTTGTNYWQAGVGLFAQSEFDENGLQLANRVFGYQFTDNTTSNRVFNRRVGDSACDDQTLVCFIKELTTWSWSSDDNFIIRNFDVESQTRRRIWEVLSYTPGGDAVVLESEIIASDTFEPQFLIVPRLNSLRLQDLSSWPDELANSDGFD